jgi:hypothetical protein
MSSTGDGSSLRMDSRLKYRRSTSHLHFLQQRPH